MGVVTVGRKVLVVLIVLVFVVLLYYFYVYSLLSRLYISDSRLYNVWFDFGKGEIVLDIKITICNPTDLDVEIDKVYYRVCIEDICTSSTIRESVFVPANDYTSIIIPIRFSIGEALKLIRKYFERKPLHARVHLTLLVPVKVFSVTIDHVKTEFSGHTEIQRESTGR